MVYNYGRKRRPRTNKTKRSRPRMSFKNKVLSALRGQEEMKIAKYSQNGLVIGNSIIDAFQIMPQIRQGTSAHAERIGNNITLHKVVVKGWIQIPSNTQTSGNTEHLARLMILRQRNASASTIISGVVPFNFNDLMEYDQPYVGTPNNWLQKVNKDAFVSRKDKKMHLSTSANFQGTVPTVPNPDSIKFFSHTITFGKQGKKLNYATDTDFTSTDFPYVIAGAVHQTDGTAITGNPTFNLYTEAFYTDL